MGAFGALGALGALGACGACSGLWSWGGWAVVGGGGGGEVGGGGGGRWVEGEDEVWSHARKSQLELFIMGHKMW